jgi:hypothetical protein
VILAATWIEARHPCLFRAVQWRGFTFLSGKATKAIGAKHDGLADIRLAANPLASSLPWIANSHIPVLGHRAFPARPAAVLFATSLSLTLR